MKRIIGIVIGCLLLHSSLWAQIVTPVHWSGERVGDSVRLSAVADEGWHLTIISIGDSMIGEEMGETYEVLLAEALPVRFNACDEQMCTAPEVWQWQEDTISIANTAVQANTPPTNSLWVVFLLGLIGGGLAIFTPCVWPIIPMTVSFFLKKGGGRKDAFLYGLSIIIIYVGLGLLITLIFGASALNQLATNAWLNIFFFLLLVVFALSFFGLFEITLPDSWATSLDQHARRQGGWLSILLMAFTLVIVSFSCTGPIIGTLLVEAATDGLLAPSVGMLGFAIALALPFSLLALFPNWLHSLPKSGQWMESFKVTLAFLELALSLKFLSVADMTYGWGILPRWLFIALWIVCFGAMGIYLFIRSFRSAVKVLRVIGFVVSVSAIGFACYLLPGLWGAPVRAIAAFAPPAPATDTGVFYDYTEGLQYARIHRLPVLIDFTGYGCVNCRKMETYVLSDTLVQRRLKDFVRITLYVDDRRDNNQNGIHDGDENSKIQREIYGSNAQPFFVRLDFDGKIQGQPCGFMVDPDKFLQWLK